MASPLNVNQPNTAQSMNPLGQPNAAAGPSRSPLPPNFGSLPHGALPHAATGANQEGATGAQALQARLAAAQQAMLGIQQQQHQAGGGQNVDSSSIGSLNGMGSLNTANAAALLGNAPGVNNEQMLRQLQAMQASHARLGQQRSPINQASPGSATAPSPSNPLAQPQPSTAQLGNPGTINGGSLNSAGSGPSISPIQLTQQQKEMLMQHQERLRRNSTEQQNPSTPTNSLLPNPATAMARPSGPSGQISQQRKQFLQSLGAYYRSLNQPLPPLIFNGERDGEVKVAGCWVDMFELFMVIMRAQGVANAIKQTPDSETWKRLFANSKLPNPLPEPLPIPLRQSQTSENTSFPTTNPVQYLVGLYVAYVKGFEDQMQKHRQQLMQRQQAAQATLAAGRPASARQPSDASQQGLGPVGTPRSTSGQAAATPGPTNAGLPAPMSAPTPPQPMLQQSTPQSSQVGPTPPPASASTPAAPSPAQYAFGAASTSVAATPNPAADTATTSSFGHLPPSFSESAQANGASSTPKSERPSSSHASAPHPAPIDTAVSADLATSSAVATSTPSSAQKRTLENGAESGEQTPARPSTPKRQRYKVEYKPIHIPMTNLAGWDERAVRSTFPKYNMGHPTHSIHELRVVDMEAILMGLRSRLPRELGYAITVLSMLSMPHPEDSLDGLPLIHIQEIYAELLALLESAAFGDDGYTAWEEKIEQREDKPEIDLASIDFMEYEQIGRHEDIMFPEDISKKDKWRKERTGGSTDIVISLINLLRNFSLYDENQSFMGRTAQTFTILSRLIDTRLVRVPGWCSGEEPFSLIEYHSVCRDVIMIMTNIGKHVNLALMPPASALSIYRLVSRILSGGLDLSNWRDPPYGFNISPKELPVPVVVTIYRATEAFYCLAGSDQNREVLGSIVPEPELVKLFDSLIKLLPNTARALDGLCSVESDLTHAECTALALYSLTFLSPLTARATMRSIPGAAAILRRLITKLMARFPSFAKSPYSVLCRRLSETLGVLNGTVTCSGKSGDLTTMGFSAGSGDGKGWRWASGIVERGWMADCRDVINQCLMMPEVDKHTFAELDGLWWAPVES